MTSERLTAILAERVMGWRVAPGRFMMGDRIWKPAWRFQPVEKREDAFHLLDAAKAAEYSIAAHGNRFTVRVLVDGTTGEATESCESRAITYAVARAIGLEPAGSPSPKTGADRQ